MIAGEDGVEKVPLPRSALRWPSMPRAHFGCAAACANCGATAAPANKVFNAARRVAVISSPLKFLSGWCITHHCIAIAKTAKPANNSAQQPSLLAMTRRKAHHDFADYPSITPFTSEDCRTFTNTSKRTWMHGPAPESLYGNARRFSWDAWILERFGKQ
jgi:hypothetical protein